VRLVERSGLPLYRRSRCALCKSASRSAQWCVRLFVIFLSAHSHDVFLAFVIALGDVEWQRRQRKQ
jgi:hypothetical protein